MEGEFEEAQAEHRAIVSAKFAEAHMEMKEILEKTHETFTSDSDEVQAEWVKYTRKAGAYTRPLFGSTSALPVK
jgi:hypothetical protein